MDRTIDLAARWDRIWARRRPILVLTIVATVAVGGIAFLLPNWYKAEAELLPPSEEDTGFGFASLMRGIAVPGVKIPTQVKSADVFIITLESRRIQEQIVDRFELKRLYKAKFMSDAVKELRTHAKFKLTEAGSIRITVEDKDRRRAAEMANAYAEFLDRFNRQVRMTKGRRTRLFVEQRLTETKQELSAAEQRLAEYQARHKTVALTASMSSAVDEAARLYARRVALQVRLGVIRGYSGGSDEEIQVRQELDQLDRQMSTLPSTGLELARLTREVKALEQIFAMLTAQHEEARIAEARDLATVELLDVATPPERKSRPHRLRMVAGAFLLSLAVGAGMALRRDKEATRPVIRAMAGE